jgi:hypothetical protein
MKTQITSIKLLLWVLFTCATVSAYATNALIYTTQPKTTMAGATMAKFAVQLTNTAGGTLSNQNVAVTLTLNSGTLSGGTNPENTDKAGKAQFADLSINKAGSYTMTATATGYTSVTSTSFNITNASVNAAQSTVTASPASVSADGSTTSTITVTLNDAYGNPVSGKTVTLAQTSGPGSPTISAASGPSSSSGVVTFTVKSTTTGADVFTATDTTDSLQITQTATVTFVAAGVVAAAQSTVTASPTSVPADGSTTSTITVTLNDAFTNPVSGKTVTLAQTSGPGTPTISAASGPSSSSGVVTFTVTSTNAGADVFTATDATDSLQITQTATVTFTAGAVTAAQSAVTASPTTVPADGSTTSTITVTLNDAYNNPVSGKTVTLAQTSGAGTATISPASGTSSSSGVVTFTVKSTTTGADVFTATDTTDSLQITQTATVTFVAAGVVAAAQSTVTASPASVPADGFTTSTITVTLNDAFSSPVSNKTVTLAQTSGPGTATISAASGPSSSSGVVTFTVKSTTAGSNVFAATDVTDSLQINQTATVIFTSNGVPPVIFAVTNTPAFPTAATPVTITAQVADYAGVASLVLTYNMGSGPTNVTMNNQAGVYSGQIPALPVGAVVDYYLIATDNAALSSTNPAGAPNVTCSYVVGLSNFTGSIVLGCPTDQSIMANIVPSNNLAQLYLEYGTSSGVYTNQTSVTNVLAGLPVVIPISQLTANTRYYYRLIYQVSGNSNYTADVEHTFITQRPPGSTFTFDIHGDSHPERTNSMYIAPFYILSLTTAAADNPDFYMTIGDDFSVDNIDTNDLSEVTVTYRYQLQRPYLGIVGCSAPVFLVNGNHEQASLYNYDTTYSNVSVWAQTARNTYYSEPAPDGFYTGDTNVLPPIGLLRNYYAWTWGDALFVTIDPYWASPAMVDNPISDSHSNHSTTNDWLITHGDAQYEWLKTTLEQSKAKYKFVFAHHVMGTGRGGIEEAVDYEWGGDNDNGTWGFTTNRPYWPAPLHQLMVANNVAAFIQGHDHIFVHQQLDGVTYQTLPNPADPNYSWFNSDAYTDFIYKANNTGYTRFTVSPTNVLVQYVRTILPANELPAGISNNAPPGVTNGTVDYSYQIFPLAVSGTANTPTPTASTPVWVTSAVSGGTNIMNVTLYYIVDDTTNTVAMLDDGLHHDGAAGDGVYGAQIPALPLGTTVTYYVTAQDAATRQFTDPSGAPFNTNMYAYTVGVLPNSLSAAAIPGTGTVMTTLSGITGNTVIFQISSDLITWTPFQTNTVSGSGGTLTVTNTINASTSQFYRALVQ